MSWLHGLLKGLAENALSSVRAWWERRLIETTLMLFCGLATLGALGFVAVGGYISLCQFFSPWQSGLIVGGILLLLSLTGALLLWRFTKSAAPHPAPRSECPETAPGTGQAPLDDVAQLGEIIGARLGQRGIHKTDVMLSALVAGTVIGVSSALRHRRRQPKGDVPDHSAVNSSR
ncbi:MAG: hypothetical protein WBS20_03980 [Lysobacterales bacterium]